MYIQLYIQSVRFTWDRAKSDANYRERGFDTVVFTDRAGAGGKIIRRIISARQSNRRERRLYDQILAEE
jgi:uncharacterized DUF497 family protein